MSATAPDLGVDRSRPLLVGLNNPYSRDPDMALYPLPPNASGQMIVRMLARELRPRYLDLADRMNLWPDPQLPTGKGRTWRLQQAGERVLELSMGRPDVVLFGRVVWEAVMCRPPEPYFHFLTLNQMTRFWHFPHPSRQNRKLNSAIVRVDFGDTLGRILRQEVTCHG